MTFHNYGGAADFEARVQQLRPHGHLLLCPEYMARPAGSAFQSILPVAKRHRVAAINWGFVSGKSQTIYPWDSWQKPYPSEPPVWFHDIFRADGRAYLPDETPFIKQITGAWH